MNNEDMVYVLSNTNFMNWIVTELNEHYNINDHSGRVTEDNIFYYSKLKTLYELVKEYAINNHIEPTISMQYSLYYVYYSGNVFFVYEGNGAYGCFNNTLDKKNILYCINFDDVVKRKLEDIINSNTGLLHKLKKEIENLYQEGISMDFVKQVLTKLIDEVKEEKVYKKK